MARRTYERYTVLIAHTDREPLVFSFRPIAFFALLGAIAVVMLLPLLICLQKDRDAKPEAVTSVKLEPVLFWASAGTTGEIDTQGQPQ